MDFTWIFKAPGSARRIPKRDPGRQKERLGASGSAPRRPKSMPSRVRERTKSSFLRTVRSQTDFQPIFARFSDVRAIRSGSTLAANFNRLGFERATPDPHESIALPYFRKGRPCRSESTRFNEAARKTAKIDPKIDPRSASAVSNAGALGMLTVRRYSVRISRIGF